MPLKAFAEAVAQEMNEDLNEGGWGRCPSLRHASLIYDRPEDDLERLVKKALFRLRGG